MVRKAKRFDCVALKRELQRKVLDEYKKLGEEEAVRRHRHWLETSEDPLAQWWRAAQASTRERKSPRVAPQGT